MSSAGSVHLLGGICGLVGTYMLGPSNAFVTKLEDKMLTARSNIGQAVLGCIVIVGAWFAFLGGATGGAGGKGNATTLCRAVTTTTIGMSFSVFVGLIWSYFLNNWKKVDAVTLIHTTLGGVVCMSAPCGDCRPWEAVLIGSISGIAIPLTSDIMRKYGIDDPVGVIACHMVPAVISMLSVGFVANGKQAKYKGIFHGGDGTLLGVQFLGLICLLAWVTFFCAGFLYLIRLFTPIRVTLQEEENGLDETIHGMVNMELRALDALNKTRRHSQRVERRGDIERQLSAMGLRMRRVDEQVLITLEDMGLLQKALAAGSRAKLSEANLSLKLPAPVQTQTLQTKSGRSPKRHLGSIVSVTSAASSSSSQSGSDSQGQSQSQHPDQSQGQAPSPKRAVSLAIPESPRDAGSQTGGSPQSEEAAWQGLVSEALQRVATVLPAEAGVQPLSPATARRITLALVTTEASGSSAATAIASVDVSANWTLV